MIPLLKNKGEMLRLLCDAIKSVYASVFYSDSKAYMTATRNIIDQEKRAYLNYCTLSYSMRSWQWKEWEKEITTFSPTLARMTKGFTFSYGCGTGLIKFSIAPFSISTP